MTINQYRYSLYRRVCTLLCIMFFPYVVLAQGKSEIRHYMLTSLSGAYVLPVGNYTHMNRFDAVTGQLAIGYEATYRHLLLQTGVGAQISSYTMTADDYTASLQTWDTQDTEFTYSCFFRNRRDKAFTTSLTVPILAGGRWSYFYFLAGLVGTFRVYETGSYATTMSSVGDYSRYTADFSDMENHAFYRDELLSGKFAATHVQTTCQISPYLEVGADFSNFMNANTGYRNGRNGETRVRVAAFMQCGLLNEHGKPAFEQPYVVDPTSPYNLQAIKIPALMDNTYNAGNALRHMSFGLRVTVLFRMAWRSAYCVSCGY